MGEMVEKVRAAILQALKQSDPGSLVEERGHECTVDGHFDMAAVARAAIAAMREPTEAMVRAGGHGPYSDADYRAMIDAALPAPPSQEER
jgi:hypothetical protein